MQTKEKSPFKFKVSLLIARAQFIFTLLFVNHFFPTFFVRKFVYDIQIYCIRVEYADKGIYLNCTIIHHSIVILFFFYSSIGVAEVRRPEENWPMTTKTKIKTTAAATLIFIKKKQNSNEKNSCLRQSDLL